MTTPESLIKKAVKEILGRHRVWYNMPVPVGYGKSMLDFIGCHRGLFFAIETKRPGKDPTPRQELSIAEMVAAGGMVFIIDDGAGMRRLDAWLSRP